MEKATHHSDDPLQPLEKSPELTSLAAEILWAAEQTDNIEQWWNHVLPLLASATEAKILSVAIAQQGHWSLTASSGSRKKLPLELLGEVLDREAPISSDRWIAVPLVVQSGSSEVLLAEASQPSKALAVLAKLVPVLCGAASTVRSKQHQRRRIRRLEAILEIAGQWNQTHEVEPLLFQMAETSTQLLGADRASIFLWDKANHVLVGRPALGVAEGELRVRDDRGVVGQVIQSGCPRRVDAAIEPEAIAHDVDAKLQYETKTLLCVPMRGHSGELFGVFEILNKHTGSFTDEDEDALVELAAHAAIALENAQDRQQLLVTNRQITDQAAQNVQLIGECPAIEALRSTVRRVADTELAVLILGENGTGKEVVSQSIHYLSSRRGQPFVAVNCAAIPDTLAESELFGHEKGAFTDAREARSGKFELADGGTLFLDEIGDLSTACQAKLLRVLEEKVLVRVGGSTPIHTNARVLAATNQNLAEMVRQKRFREDLYFRLNVVTLELPPLRERENDILLLAQHFLANFCKKARRTVPQLSEEAQQRLLGHAWPGNVRELRNLMERLAYLSTSDQIEAGELAFILSPRGDESTFANFEGSLADATTQFQVEFIRRAIEKWGGNVSQAARTLGLHRSNLYRKMRQLGMEPPG